MRLNGARLCAASKALHHLADLDVRDGFEIEASFRTQAHTTGGSKASGALVARTLVGTSAAWWLRIEDGVPRFAVGDPLIDDAAPTTTPITTQGGASNDEPLCVGAFAGPGTPRAFIGDIDAIVVRLLD